MPGISDILNIYFMQEAVLPEDEQDPRLKAIQDSIDEANMPESLLEALSYNAEKIALENKETLDHLTADSRALVIKGHHLLYVSDNLSRLPKDKKLEDLISIDPYTKFLIDKLEIDKSLTVGQIITHCTTELDSIAPVIAEIPGEQRQPSILEVARKVHENYAAKDKLEHLHSLASDLGELSALLPTKKGEVISGDRLKNTLKHLESFLSSFVEQYKDKEEMMNMLFPPILGAITSLETEDMCHLFVLAIFRGDLNKHNEGILLEYFLKQPSVRNVFEEALANYILKNEIHDLDTLNVSDEIKETIGKMVKEKLQHERIKAATHRLGTSKSSSIFRQISEEIGLKESASYTYVSLSGIHFHNEEEGAFDRQSSRWLKADIDAVMRKQGDKIKSPKRELFEHSRIMLDKIHKFDSSRSLDSESFSEQLHSDYKKGKPIMIPAGCIGHSVTITAWGNYLAITNRGLGKSPDGGTVIIKLDKPLEQKDIKDILETKDAKSIRSLNLKVGALGGRHKSRWYRFKNAIYKFASKWKFADAVLSFTGLNPTSNMPNMVGKIPQKGQKYGTCSFVNKKGALEPLIALGDIMQARHPDKDLFGEHVFNPDEKPISEEQSDFTSALEKARVSYKETTADIRDIEINRLISTISSGIINDRTEEERTNTQSLIKKVISYIENHHHVKQNPAIKDRELERSKAAYISLRKLGVDPSQKLTKDTLDAINATELNRKVALGEAHAHHIVQENRQSSELIQHLSHLSDLGYSRTPPARTEGTQVLHNYDRDALRQSATAPAVEKVRLSSAPSISQRPGGGHHPTNHHH